MHIYNIYTPLGVPAPSIILLMQVIYRIYMFSMQAQNDQAILYRMTREVYICTYRDFFRK